MPTSKRPYHFGDLRAVLIAEGERLLGEVGPGEFSVRETARRIGVSHNAPSRHFATKDSLLAAIAAGGFNTLAARYEKGAERPAEFGQVYVEFALERPALFRLMFSGLLVRADHPELALAADRSLQRASSFIAESYGTEAEAVMAAWSFVHGLAMLLLDGQIPAELRKARGNGQLAGDVLRAMSNVLQENAAPAKGKVRPPTRRRAN